MSKILSSIVNVFSLIVGWFVTHRAQVRFAILAVVLLLMAFSVFAPQLRMFAEDAPGGGH